MHSGIQCSILFWSCFMPRSYDKKNGIVIVVGFILTGLLLMTTDQIDEKAKETLFTFRKSQQFIPFISYCGLSKGRDFY